jgi:hypothetical protein
MNNLDLQQLHLHYVTLHYIKITCYKVILAHFCMMYVFHDH